MKMITAIVNKKDTSKVCHALTENGIEFTRLATTGGFLRAGNTTLLIGVDEAKLDTALDLIRKNCARRMEKISATPPTGTPLSMHTPNLVEVMVGGAIVFVNEVSYFEKM